MSPDLERKCAKCGAMFWLTAAERGDKKLTHSDRCPPCRPVSRTSAISSGLATLEQLKAGSETGVAKILPDTAELFRDVTHLARKAATPIQSRPPTWGEWFQGLDPEEVQMQQKVRAGDQADHLLRQRLELLQRFQQVATLEHQARATGLAQQQKLLRESLEIIKLEEEIDQVLALREQRLKTKQLEEARKYAQIVELMQPPSPVKEETPVEKAIAKQREELRAKAMARQQLISDFLEELHKVYRADVEDSEKAIRIRAAMESYKQEPEALPKDLREFLEQVENEGDADDV